MEIEFSPDLNKVLTFSAQETYSHVDADSVRNISTEQSISGFDIPIVPYYDKYEVTGLETCSHITSIRYEREAVSFSNWELMSINKCVEQTRIYIEIDKE